MMRILFLVTWLTMSLFAAGGELSLYVLKDGKPLPEQQVVIFTLLSEGGEVKAEKFGSAWMTDAQGYLDTAMPEGRYRLQLLATDNGTPQAFVKKNFVIVAGKQTQIILSLKTDNTLSFADVEAPADLATEEATKKDVVRVNGTVALTLLSSEDEKPIAGARVFVPGIKVNAISDAAGHVVMDLPEGNQTLSIIHTSYSSQNIKVTVLPKEMVSRTVELSPAAMELEEFVVLAPQIEGSVASTIAEVRNTDAVAEVLGAEQFSKQGDSDAAGALKRASGLTLVGGKYVYIRGLGERYSSSLLNGLHLPSPEPTKRVVPLDMFPTSVIDSIKVQKTYSANLPANFGGGNIDIRTRSVKDAFFANISVETKYIDGTTFNDVNSYKGCDNDWTGFDSCRKLSNETLNKADDLSNPIDSTDMFVKFDLVRNPKAFTTVNAPLGTKLGASVGDKIDLWGDAKLGYIMAYSYDNTWDSTLQERSKIGILSNGSVVAPTRYHTYDISDHEIKHGGILGFSLDIDDNNKIKQTNLYIHHTNDIATFFEGTNEDSNAINRYYESWVERSMLINQLEGAHTLPGAGDLRINWAGEIGQSTRDEPLSVEFTKTYENGAFRFTPQYSTNYTSGELEDNLINAKANVQYPFYLTDDHDLESMVEAGVEVLRKDRDSKTRRFSNKIIRANYTDDERAGSVDDVFSPEHAYYEDFTLGTTYKAADFYKGFQDIDAYYVRTLLKPWAAWEFSAGVRQESSAQRVETFDQYQNPVTYNLDTSDVLPELVGTYKINDEMQVRAGLSKTLTRPDFREFAPTRYQDPVTGDIIKGNEDLTYTTIMNYDARWEWYFSALENISVGLFYKEFTNPIETVKDNLDTPTYSFINADSGELYGVEVAFRKNMNFSDFWEQFYTAGNIALMESTITLNDAVVSANQLTSQSREMQGQSPYVFNFQVGFDNQDDRIVTLLYNVMGPRIVSLGSEGYPDVYEEPFQAVDFVWIEKFSGDLSLKIKFKNILDETVRWTQSGYDIRRYKPGREFTTKLEYKF
ncbi:carboxypeptidase-like regulatory domain-containing protein [Thiomicrolovo sp. ZZH C-3]